MKPYINEFDKDFDRPILLLYTFEYPFFPQIQDHLNTLTQKYKESVDQRESLKEHKKLTELRLQRANVLIGALADEKVCIL